MAVSGDLKNINLGDIFQTLSMNRQVGTLVVKDGIREKRMFFCEEGVSLGATVASKTTRLGSFLVGEEIISNEELLQALARQKEWGGMLGDHIVHMGLCAQQQIDDAIRYQAASQLYDVFFWEQGQFEFIERPTPTPADAASPYAGVSFDPNSVVMEAARQVDEWGRFQENFPDTREILVRTGDELPTDSSVEWGHDHQRILLLMDGTRDIETLFEEFHLSSMDSALITRELFEWGLVRACTTEELLETAWRFTEGRETEKAIRCLERAHDRDPANQRALELLAHSYESIDEKRAASRALFELGKLREFSGEVGPAVNALEKAARYDVGFSEPNVLLMRIYRDLGDVEGAARCAAGAAEILMDQEEFQRSVEVCREALRECPNDTNLRFRLVNSLIGMGLKDNAVLELESLAASLEAARNYRNAEEIYRKILQLDPSRTEYLKRLSRLETRAANQRKKLVRVAIACGSVVVLLLISLLLFSPDTSAEDQIAQAWRLFESDNVKAAADLANSIIASDPGGEGAIEARNLLSAIQSKQQGHKGPQTAAREKLEAELEKRYKIAARDFNSTSPLRGFDRLDSLAGYVDSQDFRDSSRLIGAAVTGKILSEYKNSAKGLVRDYTQELEKRAGVIRSEITPLLEKSLPRDSLEDLQAMCVALGAHRSLDGIQSRNQIREIAKKIEPMLLPENSETIQRLDSAVKALEEVEADSSDLYHGARALVLKRTLFTDFQRIVKEVHDHNFEGRLSASRDMCRAFLLRCDRLSHERPPEHYQPVAEELFDDNRHDIDGQMGRLLQRVEEVLEALRHGKALIDSGRLEEANAHHRDLVIKNFRIDFSDHLAMVLHLQTNPAGAKIFSQWQDKPIQLCGVTTPDGLQVAYPPYGTTKFIVQKDSFEPIEFVLSGFADQYPTRSSFSLRKLPAWKTGGGPVQGEPSVWDANVVVPSRDGHVRVYSGDTGELSADLDTTLLTGLAYAPAMEGSTAYICTPGREVLALDLSTRKRLWTFDTSAPIGVGPLLLDGMLLVADQDGGVYGVRGGESMWQRKLSGRIRANPVAVAGAACFATTEGHIYLLAPLTGEVLWEADLPGPVYAPLGFAGDDTILAFTEPSTLVAISKAGETKWTFETAGPVSGRPSSDAGHVDIVTISGTIHRLSAKTGNEQHRRSIGSGQRFRSGTVSSGDRVYLVSTLGRLFAVSPELGTQWTYDLGETVSAPPALHGNQLFTVTNSGALFGFDICPD